MYICMYVLFQCMHTGIQMQKLYQSICTRINGNLVTACKTCIILIFIRCIRKIIWLVLTFSNDFSLSFNFVYPDFASNAHQVASRDFLIPYCLYMQIYLSIFPLSLFVSLFLSNPLLRFRYTHFALTHLHYIYKLDFFPFFSIFKTVPKAT